jgi:hypothetical protein
MYRLVVFVPPFGARELYPGRRHSRERDGFVRTRAQPAYRPCGSLGANRAARVHITGAATGFTRDVSLSAIQDGVEGGPWAPKFGRSPIDGAAVFGQCH